MWWFYEIMYSCNTEKVIFKLYYGLMECVQSFELNLRNICTMFNSEHLVLLHVLDVQICYKFPSYNAGKSLLCSCRTILPGVLTTRGSRQGSLLIIIYYTVLYREGWQILIQSSKIGIWGSIYTTLKVKILKFRGKGSSKSSHLAFYIFVSQRLPANLV